MLLGFFSRIIINKVQDRSCKANIDDKRPHHSLTGITTELEVCQSPIEPPDTEPPPLPPPERRPAATALPGATRTPLLLPPPPPAPPFHQSRPPEVDAEDMSAWPLDPAAVGRELEWNLRLGEPSRWDRKSES